MLFIKLNHVRPILSKLTNKTVGQLIPRASKNAWLQYLFTTYAIMRTSNNLQIKDMIGWIFSKKCVIGYLKVT